MRGKRMAAVAIWLWPAVAVAGVGSRVFTTQPDWVASSRSRVSVDGRIVSSGSACLIRNDHVENGDFENVTNAVSPSSTTPLEGWSYTVVYSTQIPGGAFTNAYSLTGGAQGVYASDQKISYNVDCGGLCGMGPESGTFVLKSASFSSTGSPLTFQARYALTLTGGVDTGYVVQTEAQVFDLATGSTSAKVVGFTTAWATYTVTMALHSGHDVQLQFLSRLTDNSPGQLIATLDLFVDAIGLSTGAFLSSGTLVTPSVDAGPYQSGWASLEGQATAPVGTSLAYSVRSATTSGGPWSSWESLGQGTTPQTTPLQRFLQGQVTLTSLGAATPVLSELVPRWKTFPSAATNLAGTGGTLEGEISLTWTAPGGDGTSGTASSYILKYATTPVNSEGAFTAATTWTQSWAPLVAGASESRLVTGFQSGTTYYFAVKAVNEFGQLGFLSNGATAPAQRDLVAPAAISNLSALTGAADGEVNLTWTAPGDNGTLGAATSYEIRYATQDIITVGYANMSVWRSSRTVSGPDGTNELEIVTGLVRGTTYYFAVKSRDEVLNISTPSNNPSAAAQDVAPGLPQNLTALRASGGAAVALTWTANGEGDLSVYRLYRANVSGNLASKSFLATVTAPVVTYNDLGLTVSLTYYYQVTAVDLVGHESGGSAQVTAGVADTTPPGPPVGLSGIAEPAGNAARLSWTNPTDVDFAGTLVRWKLGSAPASPTDGTLLVSAPTTQTGLLHSGLANGTTYFYSLFAFDGIPNYSALAAVSVLVADSGPPNIIPDLAAQTSTAEGLIRLTWTAPGDTGTMGSAAGYTIKYATAAFNDSSWSAGYVQPLTTLAATQPQGNPESYTAFFGTLTTYYFGITAFDDIPFTSGIDSKSAAGLQAFAVPYSTPNAPVILTGSGQGISTTTLRFSWADNSLIEQGYSVWKVSSPADINLSGTLPPGTTVWDWTGFKANQSLDPLGMYVRVEAAGIFRFSGISTSPHYSLAWTPTNLASTVQSGGTITLQWQDATPGGDNPPASYRLERALTPFGPWTVVSSLIFGLVYTDTGLFHDTVYYYRVSGMNGFMTPSPPSLVFSVATKAAVVTTAVPAGLAGSSSADRRVGLTWTANTEPDLAGYFVYRRAGTSPYGKLNGSPTSPAAYTDWLDPGTVSFPTYEYVVVSYNTQGAESGFSAPVTVTPLVLKQFKDVGSTGSSVTFDIASKAYTDPSGNTQVVVAASNQDDGAFGFLVDVNKDGAADRYWQPMTGVLTTAGRDDVDGNGTVDILFLTNPAGFGASPAPARSGSSPPNFDHYWDGKQALNLGRVSGTVRDANSGITLGEAVVEVAMDAGTVTRANTGNGGYAVPLTVMHGRPAVVRVSRAGYLTREITTTLKQGSLTNALDVTLIPAGVDAGRVDLLSFPNPVARGAAARFVFNLTAETAARLDLYSDVGAHVVTLVDESLGAGVHDRAWDGRDGSGREVERGMYYGVLRAGGDKAVWKVVVK